MSLSKQLQTYIYVVGSNYTDRAGKRKLGLTIYPVHRLRQYDTGDCPGEDLEKRYQALFLTNAKTRQSLRQVETMLHTHFGDRRLPRKNGRNSEWFLVEVDEVVNFLLTRPEIIRSLSDEEIALIHDKASKDPSKGEEQELKEELELMNDQEKNLFSVETIEIDTYMTRLNTFQDPYLTIIRDFLLLKPYEALLVQAVCGFGKTIVTAKAVKDTVDRLFICVPTKSLKTSWKDALLKYAGFDESEIYELGEENLNTILKKDRFAILLCYASSHILHDVLTDRVEVGIFDEAHRLAGIVEVIEDDEEQTSEEKKRDIGRTKRLIRKCATLHVPRLSLTFTPKGFIQEEETKDLVNSNDDSELFGEPKIKVSLRKMIEENLLPPYEVLFPQVSNMYEGLKAKIQLVIHEFMKQENNVYKMNHLILFGASHSECKQILTYLEELLPQGHDIKLVYLDKASAVKPGVKAFMKAKRSIIVNCLLLGEGVSISIADSVSILCNKKSYTQIVQMLLRPGRYHSNKHKFYMIMAMNDDDDVEFAGHVMEALAQIDPELEMQILRRLLSPIVKKKEVIDDEEVDDETLTEIIQSDGALWSDIPKIRQCLQKIIRRRIGVVTTRLQFVQLRDACKRAGIRNTSGYNLIREEYGWPEAPWLIRTMTPFEFFQGNLDQTLMTQSEFRQLLQDKNLTARETYITWQRNNLTYPSMEDINDGYFGSQYTNFQSFLPSRRR